MKTFLTFGFSLFFMYSSITDSRSDIDCTGVYYAAKLNPWIISEQIILRKDGSFEYSNIYYETSTSSLKIKGYYRIQGKRLFLEPKEFSSKMGQIAQDSSDNKIKIRGRKPERISEDKHPKKFQKSLTYFNAGNLRLQPSYFIKKLNKKLSLCNQDIKTERYEIAFEKHADL